MLYQAKKIDLGRLSVNKGMDEHMNWPNFYQNKVARAKAKAMMVKIKRGTVEKTSIPCHFEIQ